MVHLGARSMLLLRCFLTACTLAASIRSASSHSSADEVPVIPTPDGLPLPRPMIIAQGGARGAHPLYSLEAYQSALQDGARALECKVALTKDGVPICCPGLNLEYITDVKAHAAGKFAGLYSAHLILNDKEPSHDGWFIFNFTISQLLQVHVIGDIRHPKTLVNGKEERRHWGWGARMVTVRELLELAVNWTAPPEETTQEAATVEEKTNDLLEGKHVTTGNAGALRIILEPLYAEFMWNEMKLAVDIILMDLMKEFKLLPGATQRSSDRVAVHVQSREATLLRFLSSQAPALPLIQVLDTNWDKENAPFPILPSQKTDDTWRERCWDDISQYAWAVSVDKDLLIPRNPSNFLMTPAKGGHLASPAQSEVAASARSRNLSVLAWSFCDSSLFGMAFDFSQDPYAEHDAFVEGAGVDGIFTSCPATSARYLESRLCLQLLQSGQPIGGQNIGWAELVIVSIIVLIAVLPMGAGLMYAIYKWRQSEQFLMWQEFTTGLSSFELGASSRPTNAGMMRAAMGPTQLEMENIPLTDAEWSPSGVPRASESKEEKGEEANMEKAELLKDGEVGTRHNAGTWRMRKGAEWNSDDAWK